MEITELYQSAHFVMARLEWAIGINTMNRAIARSGQAMTVGRGTSIIAPIGIIPSVPKNPSEIIRGFWSTFRHARSDKPFVISEQFAIVSGADVHCVVNKNHCCPVNKAVASMAYIMLPIGICTPDFKLMFSSMVCKRPASPALFRPLLMPRLSTLRSA